jgi:hypothetical protein
VSERAMDYSACWPVPLLFAGLIAAASSARFFIDSSLVIFGRTTARHVFRQSTHPSWHIVRDHCANQCVRR